MLTFHEYIFDSRKLLNNIVLSNNNSIYNDKNKILADFVIGAPVADLDSIISVLLRAYYLSSTYYKLIRKEGHRHVFAVLPIVSADFEINGIMRDLLRSLNILQKDLIFLDDLIALQQQHMDKIEIGRVNLCNHSILMPELNFLEPFVYSIVDCHKDIGSYDFIVHENLRVIDETASCTSSLIAEMYVVHEEMFFNQYFSNPLDPLESQKVTSKLIFNTIVYQTLNLDQTIVKEGVNHVDIQMVDYFAKKFHYNAEKELKHMQFILKSYKFWHNLSIYDKMRCYFKRYDNIGKLGISNIPLPIDNFVIPIKNPNTGKRSPRVGYNQKEVEGYEGIQNVIDILYDKNMFVNVAYEYMELNDIEVYIIMAQQLKEIDPAEEEERKRKKEEEMKEKAARMSRDNNRNQTRTRDNIRNNAMKKFKNKKKNNNKAKLKKAQQDKNKDDSNVLSKQILIASKSEWKFNGFIKKLCNEYSDFNLTPIVKKKLCLGTSDMGEEILSSTWGGQLVENVIEGENEHVHFRKLYIKLFDQGNMSKDDQDVVQLLTKFMEFHEEYGNVHGIKFHKV